MKPPKSDDFADRRKTANEAKKALLERARAARPAQSVLAEPSDDSDPKARPKPKTED